MNLNRDGARPSGNGQYYYRQLKIDTSPRLARSSIWTERLATDKKVGGSSPCGRTESDELPT
jgi:hypothetical protein